MFLTSVIVSIGATLLFAWLVFKPITHQPTGESGPRFQLADLFSLIVLWQYGLFLATTLQREGDGSGRLVVGGVLILVLTTLWFGLATSLSERNVRSGWRRGVVICIGAPLGIAGTICLLPSVMFSIVQLWNPRVSPEKKEWEWVLLACLGAGVVARLSLSWAMRKPAAASGDERDAAVEIE